MEVLPYCWKEDKDCRKWRVNDMAKGIIKGIYEAAKQESIQAKLFILLCVSYGGEQVLEWIKGSD